MKLGTRGLGTDLRISAGVLNIHKTRLNDPHLSFLGTNDHPGDYRSSGCTGLPRRLRQRPRPGQLRPVRRVRQHGHLLTARTRPFRATSRAIPIEHRLTRAIPTSQCMVCHMHQPNSFVNTFLGYQMWDYETDGELLWPKTQRYRDERRADAVQRDRLPADVRQPRSTTPKRRRRAGSGPTSSS